MYGCFHCGGERTVVWDADFSFEDCCYEGEGIVQMLHCTNCGAKIMYLISLDTNKEEEE